MQVIGGHPKGPVINVIKNSYVCYGPFLFLSQIRLYNYKQKFNVKNQKLFNVITYKCETLGGGGQEFFGGGGGGVRVVEKAGVGVSFVLVLTR